MTTTRGLTSTVGLVASLFAVTLTAAEPTFQPPQIEVPDGFTVELAAAPPLLGYPMMAAFDPRGRLFIAESTGVNMRPGDLEAKLPNLVRMLEDTDGDGCFDKSTIFADKMTQPMGAVWARGSLYVASPPNIWKLTDTDDDGVADRREEIVGRFNYNGNAASIHGCFLGPGGRVYWTDGRHGHEFVDNRGKVTSKGKAARIFSCRLDGSDVKTHCGGGMDNPVEIDFAETGEMFGTVNLFYKKRGDCIVHWMHGGAYPRYDQESCIAEFPSTGKPLLEVLDVGHVAISGFTRYRGDHLGPGFQDSYFYTEFNTHKVRRVRLTRDGATFRGEHEDFLSSPSIDFHPTDVLEDADGSLLVIDTGGWFRIGCPVSQVSKPEIPGAIYRIRKSGGAIDPDPRGLKLAWQQATPEALAARLDDARFAVREQAIETLAARGDAAVSALSKSLTSSQVRIRRNAVWSLCRIGTDKAKRALRTALNDKNSSVVLAAAQSAGTLHDAGAVEPLIRLVASKNPAIRRASATALGQIGDRRAVPAILAALALGGDRVLEHALIYALIEIDDRPATLAGLSAASPDVRRAALMVLDQMPHGGLTQALVAPLLDTDDIALEKTVLEVLAKHEGWSDEIVALAQSRLAANQLDSSRLELVRGALLAFSSDEKVQAVIAAALERGETSKQAKLMLLEVIARSQGGPLPESWSVQLARLLASPDDQLARQAVEAAGRFGPDRFDRPLYALARDEHRPVGLRVAALRAAADDEGPLSKADFRLLRGQLDSDAAPIDRLTAAGVLGRAGLTAPQIQALLSHVRSAGPLELPALIGAFERSEDEATGLALVAALREAPGANSLAAARLEKLLSGYPTKVRDASQSLLAELNKSTHDQAALLEKLKPAMSGGDAERGKLVFFSKRTACYACHRVGSEGGNVGPNLSAIGKIRTRRDLLEAVALPSASLARGFETYAVITDGGLVHSGVISRETADAVYLRTAQRAEIRVGRASIDEIAPSPVSVMPQGLDKTMTVEQLQDLLAYLSSLKL